MPRLSTSSWSLHRALGRPPLFGPGQSPQEPSADAEIDLLALPDRLAGIGINTVEIVHFHFPTLDAGYLDELRAALERAGVELFSILVDAGNITEADDARRTFELDWIRAWLEIAARVGASHARIVAGYTPVISNSGDLKDNPIVRRSAATLLSLADFAAPLGLRLITENFRETGNRAHTLMAILDQCEGKVGLCVDFGNAKGAEKTSELALLFPYADSAHVKEEYDESGAVDEYDLTRHLDLLVSTRFDGPLSLIFDSPLRPGETEWDNLLRMRALVAPYTAISD